MHLDSIVDDKIFIMHLGVLNWKWQVYREKWDCNTYSIEQKKNQVEMEKKADKPLKRLRNK